MELTRRDTLLAGLFFGVAGASPIWAEAEVSIHVVKDPVCPCCDGWIGHLRENGFPVSFEVRSNEDLAAFKRERGVPDDLVSCHTGTSGNYTFEGHVPSADIRRLLAEMPAAIGLSVPGMVTGSPGMGPEAEREAYDVILIGLDGHGTVFSSYPAA